MEGYWETVRVHNKEHRWMRQHDTLQGVSLVMGEFEVCVRVWSVVQSSDQRSPDSRLCWWQGWRCSRAVKGQGGCPGLLIQNGIESSVGSGYCPG